MRDGFRELIDQVFNNNLESRKKLMYLFLKPDLLPITECPPIVECSTAYSPVTDTECLPIAEYSSITEYSTIAKDELELLEAESAAFLPSATACFIKGMCAFLQKDNVSAIKYFDDAIELNDADAMNFRGIMHTQGYGGPINKRAAIDLWSWAADLGNLDAMYHLAHGMCYRALANQKKGKSASYKEAFRLLDETIKKGHSNSMALRAKMHFFAAGGPRNCSEAGKLFRQSSLSESFKTLKSMKDSYLLWLMLPSKQYQTLQYHCAAAEKEITPCLKRYPHTLTDFLTDSLLTKGERDSILDTLEKDFFVKRASHFVKLIINVFNDCQEKSVVVSNFSILQDYLPFTLKKDHLLPLIKKLFKEGSNRKVYDLLLTEYQKYDSDYNPTGTPKNEEVLPKKTVSSKLYSSLSSCLFYQSHKGSSREKHLKTNDDIGIELSSCFKN